MRTDVFDFDLPEDRIALRLAAPRDFARLLVVRQSSVTGAAVELEDRVMRDLPALLQRGDALVVNDTKVFPANLHGRRLGRGEHEPAIAAILIKRLDDLRFPRPGQAGESALRSAISSASAVRVGFAFSNSSTPRSSKKGRARRAAR